MYLVCIKVSQHATRRHRRNHKLHSLEVQNHTGTAHRPKLILTFYDPMTFTFDLLTQSIPTANSTKVKLCAILVDDATTNTHRYLTLLIFMVKVIHYCAISIQCMQTAILLD